jgi:hypothetical protein
MSENLDLAREIELVRRFNRAVVERDPRRLDLLTAEASG